MECELLDGVSSVSRRLYRPDARIKQHTYSEELADSQCYNAT